MAAIESNGGGLIALIECFIYARKDFFTRAIDTRDLRLPSHCSLNLAADVQGPQAN